MRVQAVYGVFLTVAGNCEMMQAEEARMFYLTGGVRDRWIERRKKLISTIAGIISKGVAAGQIRGDIPPEMLAGMLMGMLRARAHDLEGLFPA